MNVSPGSSWSSVDWVKAHSREGCSLPYCHIEELMALLDLLRYRHWTISGVARDSIEKLGRRNKGSFDNASESSQLINEWASGKGSVKATTPPPY